MLKGHLSPPDSYRAIFDAALAGLPGVAHDHVRDARRAAFAQFEDLGLPTAKAEAWKYTPVATLLPRQLSTLHVAPSLDRAAIRPFVVTETLASLVFVDGIFAEDLSDMPSAGNGVTVRRLSDALADGDPVLLSRIAAGLEGGSFDALNVALVRDGCVLEVAAGSTTTSPVQIVHVLDAEDPEVVRLASLCHVVTLGEEAQAHVIETTVCRNGAKGVLNVRNRCSLARGARLTHERLQVGSSDGSVLARSTYEISADAWLTQNVVTLGGRLVRSEIGARLGGSNVESRFNGLYAVGSGEHVDNALQIRHAAPGSMSDQAYRGVLDGRARAAFAGQIVVERPAQQTNAYQSNNNLLLSPEAEINTKPELEIFADDVKCSHGATAGEIDEGALFYLRSRGLDDELARSLLTFAFAGEVLERLVDPSFAQIARRELLAKLPGGDALQELMS
jgi:Fe-S cluster assembly protein SufD